MHTQRTAATGYNTDTNRVGSPKRCVTCEHFVAPDLCQGKHVLEDRQVETDRATDLKVISAAFGLCDYWAKD